MLCAQSTTGVTDWPSKPIFPNGVTTMAPATEHPAGFACFCLDTGGAIAPGTQSISSHIRSLHGWMQRQSQRSALLDLDDRLLHDIGISRADAEREAAKSFWAGFKASNDALYRRTPS